MLSKEEIEDMNKLKEMFEYASKVANIKLNSKACELFYRYMEQLESALKELEERDKKLIDKLEKDMVNITKTLRDGKHSDDYSRCRLKAYRTKTKEILQIVKGGT